MTVSVHTGWVPVTAAQVRAGGWRDIGVDGAEWALAQAAERAMPGDSEGQMRWMRQHAREYGVSHAG